MHACLKSLPALAVLLTAALPAHAAYLRYKDDAGTIHIVEDRGEIPEKYRSRAIEMKQPERSGSKRATARAEAPDPQPRVEVYVTSWCGACQRLEAFLEKEQIRHTRYDIEKSSFARKRYDKLGASGVPVTKIGTHIISGYNPVQIQRRLGRDETGLKSAFTSFTPGSWSIGRTLLGAFGIFLGFRFLRKVW